MTGLPELPWDAVNARDAKDLMAFLGVDPAGTEPRKYPCIQCASSDALHAYPGGRNHTGIHCYSCGRSWSNIDAVAYAHRVEPHQACKALARHFGIHVDEAEPKKRPRPKKPKPKPVPEGSGCKLVNNDGRIPKMGAPIVRYDYPGPDGVTLHAVLRYEAEGSKTFRQVHRHGAKEPWHWGQMAPHLYHLPSVLEAVAEGQTIWLTEGEKDADRLRDEGLEATTWAGGAWALKEDGEPQQAKWRDHHTAQLQDARLVAIVTDHDTPGHVTGQAILDELLAAGIEAVWIHLPAEDLGPLRDSHGPDVSDWLDQGHDGSDLDELLAHAGRTTWPEPEPLGPPEKGPPMPIELLPEAWAAYVMDLAAQTQTMADMPFMASLGAVSAAVAKKAELQVRPGWTEPLNLYSASVARPGERKSAVMGATSGPVRAYEMELFERTKGDRAKALGKQRYLKKAADKALEKAARDPSDLEAEHAYLRAQEAVDTFEVPAAPRLLVSDATPERTTQLMAENHGRIAVLDPEADPLTSLASMRYNTGNKSMGATLDLLKKAWSNEDLIVDRMNRDNTTVRGAALTMALSVQPSVLEALGSQEQLFGEGLLARIIYAVPGSMVGSRKTGAAAPQPTAPVRQRFNAVLKTLLDARPAKGAMDRPGTWGPHMLHLGTEARAVFYAWEAEVEDMLLDAPDTVIRDWLAKLAGNTARVAACLHLFATADRSGDPWIAPNVSEAAMEAAVAIARCALDHAYVAFHMMRHGIDASTGPLERLLGRIRKRADEHGDAGSTRELYRSVRRSYASTEAMVEHLKALEQRGWIRLRKQMTSGGRPPSDRILVRPDPK